MPSQQQQQQQQQMPDTAVNFLILCDPRFQQSKQLLAGLDFAFPHSNKVGCHPHRWGQCLYCGLVRDQAALGRLYDLVVV
jgi:small ligand-binding sensory domain FIST